ncbi:uncharacterized protein [Leptinotarsa decemlineata]|uniref:uncharacterized protein n=1 Tax=Leptinotarsa decemlineata TaxID=7539 RepID=UPI003D304FF9
MLYGVVQSILLYGALVWYGALKIERYKAKMTSVQRKALIRVTSAYRTASAATLQVISGIPPINLLAEESAYTYASSCGTRKGVREAPRERTMKRWQKEWEDHGRAQWTKVLIPEVELWAETKHKKTDYYFTQFLTGHGAFKKYTEMIGKTEDGRCEECGRRDIPNHVVFECPRYENERNTMEKEVGEEITSRFVDIYLFGENRCLDVTWN